MIVTNNILFNFHTRNSYYKCMFIIIIHINNIQIIIIENKSKMETHSTLKTVLILIYG